MSFESKNREQLKAEMTAQLGLPEIWNPDYESLLFSLSEEELADTSMLTRGYWEELNGKYELLAEFAEAVYGAAEEAQTNPLMLAYINLTRHFLTEARKQECGVNKAPLPTAGGSKELVDLAGLLALFPLTPLAKADYEKAGFAPEVVDSAIGSIGGSFVGSSRRLGNPVLDRTYFNWIGHYIECRLVNMLGFNWEVRTMPGQAYYYRNQKTGELKVLMSGSAAVHSSGRILGSAGCKEEEGSWLPTYEETETAYIGFGVSAKGLVETEKTELLKADWTLVLKPGDKIVGLHIPKKADLSRENLDQVLPAGLEKMRKANPDKDLKGLFCSSWLFDPQLAELLGEQSRIVCFQRMFVRFPEKNNGMGPFTFAFPAHIDLASFEPTTTLQRKLKEHYLSGRFIYFTGGLYQG